MTGVRTVGDMGDGAFLGGGSTSRAGNLNPAGMAGSLVLITGLILIALVPLDWAFPSGTRATQLGVDDADRAIPQAIRGVLVAVLLVYVALTGWDPGGHGFALGSALFVLTAYMFLSVFFCLVDVTSRFHAFLRSLPLIVAAIASYRLTLAGYVSVAGLRYLAGVVVILASVYTIVFCLDADRRIGQNADGALLLWCIPLLLLARPSLRATALAGLASTAIFATVKRGSILALLVGALAYYFTLVQISGRGHRITPLIVAGLIVLAITAGLLWQWENIEYRLERDLEGGGLGSGRTWFYRAIIWEWYEGGPLTLLFGKGFFTVPDTLEALGTRIYAHSDWLEILHDMGLVGIALFTWLYARIAMLLREALRQRNPIAPALAMGCCIFALRSVYSQIVIGESMTIYFGLLLGYSAALIARERPFTRPLGGASTHFAGVPRRPDRSH